MTKRPQALTVQGCLVLNKNTFSHPKPIVYDDIELSPCRIGINLLHYICNTLDEGHHVLLKYSGLDRMCLKPCMHIVPEPDKGLYTFYVLTGAASRLKEIQVHLREREQSLLLPDGTQVKYSEGFFAWGVGKNYYPAITAAELGLPSEYFSYPDVRAYADAEYFKKRSNWKTIYKTYAASFGCGTITFRWYKVETNKVGEVVVRSAHQDKPATYRVLERDMRTLYTALNGANVKQESIPEELQEKCLFYEEGDRAEALRLITCKLALKEI